MSKKLRIAVCQIECHPFVTVGDRNFAAEPFLPFDKVSLASLARHALDVSQLQSTFYEHYLAWQTKRLRAILETLSNPAFTPHIMVFPEGSVPLDFLFELQEFAKAHNTCIFAGTHSFRITSSDESIYKSLGVKSSVLRTWEKRNAGTAILPVILPTRCEFRLKQNSSVFEETGLSSGNSSTTPIESIEVEIEGHTYGILPLVCADALHIFVPKGQYELVVIVAHNHSIDPFLSLIQQQTFNRIPVVFCNDGKFGGSCVAVQQDQRMDTWWWSAPRNGRLSCGDAILNIELDMDSLAPQVGVADPRPSARLISISDVAPNGGYSPIYSVARTLQSIRLHSDHRVQVELLDQCLTQSLPSEIQTDKIQQLRRLAAQATADELSWDTLAAVCVVDGLPTLTALECDFSRSCIEALGALLANATVPDDTALARLARFLKHCRDKVASSEVTGGLAENVSVGAKQGLINREDEIKTIRVFLESRHESVLVVTGLEGVGKTTILDAAIAQAGRSRAITITLTPDSSPDFIAEYLARSLRLPRSSGDAIVSMASLANIAIGDFLPFGSILVIENAHYLFEHDYWRDQQTPTLLKAITAATYQRSAKLIIEANRRIDLDIDPARTRRVWIKGLGPEPGRLFLDQQLRRAGLDPGHYAEPVRSQVASDLGGHPGAIILATEYIDELGIEEVATELKLRTGVHSKIVRQILSQLSFSEEEQAILSLLSQSRIPIPATVLNSVLFHNCLPSVNTLIRKSVVERHAQEHVALAPLVAGFADFANLAPETILRFHFVMAENFAQLSGGGQDAVHLRWAVESRYHAQLAGNPQLAPNIGDLIDGLLGAAIDLIRQKRFEQARPSIDELLRSHRTGETCELGAVVYARLGMVEEALVLAKEAISLDPHRGWALTEVGRLALHVHRDEVAVDALNVARKLGHDTTYAATLEGRIHLRRSDLDEAIGAFQRGVSLSEARPHHGDGWPYFYLGRTLIRGNRLDEAVEVLFRGEEAESERYRTRRDVLVAIRTQLALAYILLDNLPAAERLLGLILSHDARTPEVAKVAAYFRAASGARDVAEKALRELDPLRARDRFERCQGYLFRGLFYLQLDQPENASREFALGHREDPRNVFVLLKWANTLVEMATESTGNGEMEIARYCAEQAQTVAKKVIEFDTDNGEALRILEKLAFDFHVI